MFDIVYLGRLEKPWLQFSVGFICVMVLIGYTIWPMLYMFLESGIPSFMYGLQNLMQPVQQFQNYLTPEYWSFSNRQATVYEQTTDDAGVPPNIEFSISSLEIKPSSEALFDQTFVLQMTIENSGDNDISITRGFKAGEVDDISTSYPCPCEILRRESDGWISYNSLDDDQYTLNAECETLFLNSEGEEKRDWGEAISGLSGHVPLIYSACGDLGTTNLRAGLPHNDYCTNVVYYPRHDDLQSETCQIEAWAEADLHSRGILSVQVADDLYYFQQNLVSTTVPSITSTGAGIVSISVGKQPLLDIDPAMILTVGYENSRSGLVTDFYQIYFFIPYDLGICSDDDSYFQCGGQELCPVDIDDPTNIYYPNIIRDDPKYEDWMGHEFVQDFVEECNVLTDPSQTQDQKRYRVCRLNPTGGASSKKDLFGSFILDNGFGAMVCTLDLDDGSGGSIVNLENQFRKSYLFRSDSFYRYQVGTVADVHGVKIG
ncbi:MAG: hypothetical protein E4H14_20270 [Candidatus Thorarchaeota archaeon]|nr:MAG: hypothetical protein E4H14_20270 [Candidatus Thorarchaeota archaeon]